MAGRKKNFKVSKTKAGHDFRVRGPRGRIRGEYETKRKAERKERRLENRRSKSRKKR